MIYTIIGRKIYPASRTPKSTSRNQLTPGMFFQGFGGLDKIAVPQKIHQFDSHHSRNFASMTCVKWRYTFAEMANVASSSWLEMWQTCKMAFALDDSTEECVSSKNSSPTEQTWIISPSRDLDKHIYIYIDIIYIFIYIYIWNHQEKYIKIWMFETTT